MSYRILIPIDFSDVSDRQLEAAARIVGNALTHVQVLHVNNDFPEYMGAGESSEKLSLVMKKDRLTEAVHVLKNQLENKPFCDVFSKLTHGEAVPGILNEARKFQADLIVAGSHGHGAVYDLFVGSVAKGILEKSPVPVLVVPSHWEDNQNPLNRMTVGLDMSGRGKDLIRNAIDIANALKISLRLLHVVPRPEGAINETDSQTQQLVNQRLFDLARAFQQEISYPIKTEMLLDLPEEALLKICNNQPDNLLVLGSHQLGSAMNLLIGSVAQTVIKKTTQPILIVPLEKKPEWTGDADRENAWCSDSLTGGSSEPSDFRGHDD